MPEAVQGRFHELLKPVYQRFLVLARQNRNHVSDTKQNGVNSGAKFGYKVWHGVHCEETAQVVLDNNLEILTPQGLNKVGGSLNPAYIR